VYNAVSLTPAQLPDFLVQVAPERSVFIWGQPGIGKSDCVAQFAEAVGMDCVSLLGSQLAPEDLMGVPQIVDGKTRFHPPAMIAREDPYVLFCDELNGATHDIQKAFYSLIHEHRIGEYRLPDGSVVIGAGNRSQDSAIVRPMSSALINRMIHVSLRADYRSWMEWAKQRSIHPLVLSYLQTHPDHLVSAPPKSEEPFSSPRAWHMLSDALNAYAAGGEALDPEVVKVLAYGTLTHAHATAFAALAKIDDYRFVLSRILKGEQGWPMEPDRADQLYFLAGALRSQLLKELPPSPRDLSASAKALRHNATRLILELADLNEELAKTMLARDEQGRDLPDWFILELATQLPRLAAARA
jgi:MoxR-like ATPase